MSEIKFDPRISLGHVISIIAMLIAGVLAYASLAATIEMQNRRLDKVEASQIDRETRLRALEIGFASQTTDLANIAAGIIEIKRALERMSGTENHK